MRRTFKRIGVPAAIDADRVYYEPPEGWKVVDVRRLDCGWLSLILEKIPSVKRRKVP